MKKPTVVQSAKIKPTEAVTRVLWVVWISVAGFCFGCFLTECFVKEQHLQAASYFASAVASYALSRTFR